MKQFLNLNVKSTDLENRTIRFLGSDDSIDRDNEVLTIDGWDIKNYKKNPVFLWAHKYNEPPIGKAINTEMTKNGLEFDIKFADAETYPFADTIYKLYKGGYLSAVSVGFVPNEVQVPQGNNADPVKMTKKELLELSAVPVPANPNALQMGIKSTDDIQDIKKAVNDEVINEFELSILKDYSESFINNLKEIETNINTEEDQLPIASQEQKSGRVLSKKNEKLINAAIEKMTEVTTALTDLLKTINEEQQPGAESEPEKITPEPKKSGNIYEKILSIEALKIGKKEPELFNKADVENIYNTFK